LDRVDLQELAEPLELAELEHQLMVVTERAEAKVVFLQ
jgi:hypothetical protein